MQKYECKNCGADLHWDPTAGSLKCKYCESEYQPTDFEDATIDADPTKSSNVDAAYTNAGADLADDMVVYKCDECGAEVVTSKTTMATGCAYCGRSISITNKSAGNFRPDKILPFAIEKKKAMEIFKNYAKGAILSPKEFKTDQTIEKMQGLYVPFYLHDAHMEGTAEVTGETRSDRRRGYDKVTTHKVYEIDVHVNANYENIPTDGAKKIDDKLMNHVEPFTMDKICEYNPAYMAGYFAEQPDESKEETKDRAVAKINDAIKESSCNTAGSYHNKRADIDNVSMGNYSCSYAMLPIWMLHVKYKGKTYEYAINGDTGKVVGKLPVAISKIVGIPGAIVAAHALLSAILMW